MSAYWINIYREITDEAKVAAYAELAGPARAAHDSAAYQEALAALDAGAVRDLRIVPGAD